MESEKELARKERERERKRKQRAEGAVKDLKINGTATEIDLTNARFNDFVKDSGFNTRLEAFKYLLDNVK